MNRAFFVLLLVGLQLLSLTPNRTSAAEDLTPVIKKTQGGVAQVVCYDVEGKIFKYGSGFFVSPEGQFVTSRNLVLGASKAVIKMGDLREFPVKAVLAENKSTELVKLLIEPAGNPWPVFVVTEKMPDLGARVLALGYNRKTQLSVMEGMVSGVQDFLSFGKVIQISAHVTPAGSGGPVVNLQGEVIGVGRSGKSEGQDFNFAVSGAQVRALQPGLPQPFEEWASSRLDEAVTLHLTRGSQYLKAGRSEEALLAYRQATRIKTQTGSAPAHYELGMAYLKTNKVPEAQKELQVLTKLDARLAEKLEASIAAAASGTEEARLPELIKKVKPAVLFVQVYDKQDRPSRFGSAFFINAKGHFITNYHVLQGAFQAKVKTSTGKIYQVTRILAEDRDADLIMAAVVPEVEMPYLQVVGTLPQIGERVLVVGNPKGLELTAADGIVSAIRGRQKKMIQISAPISPGSSGSPLLNLKGQVIGVNTLMVTEGQMLNFASASQNILAMKRAPGLSLKERAEGWEAEANEYLKQGRKAMKAKNYRQALQFLEEGKKTCPDLPEIYYYLCLLHLTLGNEREFAAALSSLNQLDPEMARNLVARINAAQSKKGR